MTIKQRIGLQVAVKLACLRCFRTFDVGPSTFNIAEDGSKLNIEFAFPEGWKVVPQPDNTHEALCPACTGIPKKAEAQPALKPEPKKKPLQAA